MVVETRRYREKRKAILDAAAQLINRRGVRGTTLADVAERVGLVTNSVTYYYRKKEDLAAACLLYAIEQFDVLIAEAEAGKTPEARVAAFISGYFRILVDIETGVSADLVGFNDISSLTGPSLKKVQSAYIAMFKRVRGLLSSGKATPFGRAELNARGHLLLALTLWGRVWAQRYDVAGYPRAALQVTDILLNGIGKPSSVWAPMPLPEFAQVKRDETELSPEGFLRAATRLINQHGYGGFSIEGLSASLNVTKGAFYYHNENKEDLIYDCFARTFEIMRRAQMAVADCPNGWQKLSTAAAALVRFQLSAQGPLLRVTARSALPQDRGYDALKAMSRLSEGFANFIVDGMIDGSVRPLDQTVAAQMISGLVNASASSKRWVPGVTIDNVVDLYAKPLFFGLFSDPAR